MNIYANPGAVIIFNKTNNGSETDRSIAAKYLIEGQSYTVEQTRVRNWCSDVELKEVPGVKFNTVLFSDTDIKGAPRPEATHRVTRIENTYIETRPMTMRTNSDPAIPEDHPNIKLNTYFDGIPLVSAPKVDHPYVFKIESRNGCREGVCYDDCLITTKVTRVDGDLFFTKNSTYKIERL